jgi:death on curing protein
MSDEELVIVNPKQVLFLHDEQVKLHGGSLGVRDWHMFKSACLQPYASFGGQDLYPTIFDKAAAMIRSMIKDHPFVDANKRTAITVAQTMLELSGYKFRGERKETYNLLLAVANENLSVDEIARWLKEKTSRL